METEPLENQEGSKATRPGEDAGGGRCGTILVVDDDPSLRLLASEILTDSGYSVETADSGYQALEKLEQQPIDLVVADLVMPGMDGFQLLQKMTDDGQETPVIFLTGQLEISSAVKAIKQGAENYVTKPFESDHLEVVVRQALEKKRLRDENARLRRMVWEKQASYGSLVGRSRVMQTVYGAIDAVGPTESTVLILGESGTGKELIAREVHRRSRRSSGPFLAVNCSALPPNLLESELFGHVRGAFTGAASAKAGLFEAARSGTIFLDEIGSTTPQTQQSLLRVLQEREIRRVGDTASHSIDVRVIAATNADLESEMRAGTFRTDLYFRLSGVIVRMPPLRQRPQDIPLLAEHFLAQVCRRQNREPRTLSPRALEKLQRYDWPGNVRELENVMERAVIFARDRKIGPSDLDLTTGRPAAGQPEDLSLDSMVRRHISLIL
ncbi:MAG: sigma-54-dependent transcriptional regulator, partial [Acidobacteriota bacterium]